MSDLQPATIIQDERPLRSLFLDLNAFFASVEQQEDPALRGKPVAVVPVLSDGSCVVAASYEAKKYGIKTGTLVSDARKMCPNIVLRSPHFHLYSYYHHQVIAATENILPIEQVCSVDEFHIRLIGKERLSENAISIARKIKKEIHEKVGECLTSSIGIAPNAFLAKIGTELEKPNGLVVIEKDSIVEKLSRLNLTDLPGINKRMNLRLCSKGIFSVYQLLHSSRQELHKAFGSIVGERWWYLLRGYDVPMHHGARKSLGHSNVLGPEFRTDTAAREVMVRLIQKATSRMHSENLWAKGMSVRVSGYKKSWSEKMKFPPTQDFNKFIQYFQQLWDKRDFLSPRLVGVVFYDFVDQKSVTPSLFDPFVDRFKLNQAVDDINLKFGKHSVHLAGMHCSKDLAKEKLAFQKTELFNEGEEKNP